MRKTLKLAVVMAVVAVVAVSVGGSKKTDPLRYGGDDPCVGCTEG